MISKWFPQQTILSHPVRLYYTVVITPDPDFSIGYRLVFKSLWTQQCFRSFIARYTNVGNLPLNTKNYLLTKIFRRIAWPLEFDQPGIAAYISLSLDVAFELIQVRTGIQGLKCLHRTRSPPVDTYESVTAEARDVFRRIMGSEGDQKRRNAEAVRDKLSRAWKNAGEGVEDFRRLLCDATKD